VRWRTCSSLPSAPTHLAQPRADAHQGDSASSRQLTNQALFALWKDADPDIPILKEAKAEYAKLQ
jgi:eukaryotic-like serine/threonine-protein kinase